MKILIYVLVVLMLFSCTEESQNIQFEGQDLVYSELATVWDEAIPLGNGMVGNLVWQKEWKPPFFT